LPGEGKLPKDGEPLNPEWPIPTGKAKTLDLSTNIAADSRVKDTNNRIEIFFKERESFLMIGKFEELLNLECESRKNCLLKSD
jgi:hypothetical protein